MQSPGDLCLLQLKNPGSSSLGPRQLAPPHPWKPFQLQFLMNPGTYPPQPQSQAQSQTKLSWPVFFPAEVSTQFSRLWNSLGLLVPPLLPLPSLPSGPLCLLCLPFLRSWHPIPPVPVSEEGCLRRKSPGQRERLSCLGDEGGSKDREARSPQEVGGVGGHSPIPLSSSSCSHNALGQECKRQLRPPQLCCSSSWGATELWGDPAIKRELEPEASHLVPWGSGSQHPEQTAGAPGRQPGVPGCCSPPPTSPGNSGALVPLSNLHAYPRWVIAARRSKQEEPGAEIQRQAEERRQGETGRETQSKR